MKRPFSVSFLGCLFIGVGLVSLVYHLLRDRLDYWTLPISLVGILAIHIGAAHTAVCSTTYLLLSQWKCAIFPVGNQHGSAMKQKTDVLQGTLALMVLKTLEVLGPLHGYGIARRIEQISGDLLAVNQGTLYPVLLKLEQEDAIASEWGASENNRRARFYRLTREGRKQLQAETQDWQQTAAIIGRFFQVKPEDLS
jgi:PadR family transcriptional regulator, regulatory protein PadR